jgi:hypothetical protein
VSPHNTTTTTHHTKLHYTTTKHKHTQTHTHSKTKKQKHTNTLKQKHTNTNTFMSTNTMLHALSISLPAGSHNLAIRELLFLFLFLSSMSFVYCIVLCFIVYFIMYLSVYLYTCICIYTYCCCFRYLNGVCPIRDGHCGHHHHHHQHAPAQCFPLCRRVMMIMTPLRLLHPLSLNSSIVFCLRQRIASG